VMCVTVRREGNSFTWDGRETRRFFSGSVVIRSGTNELSVLLEFYAAE
jgi:hypothetical protein